MSKIFSRRDQAEMSVTPRHTTKIGIIFELCMWSIIIIAITLVWIGCTFGISSFIWAGIYTAIGVLGMSILDLLVGLMKKLASMWVNNYDRNEGEEITL